MRNDQTIDVPTTLSWYRLAFPGTVFNSTTTHRAKRTYRDEITTTPPRGDGSFFEPTSYRAFFATCTAKPFDYTFMSGSQKARAYGISSSSRLGTNPWRNGCGGLPYPVPTVSGNRENQVKTEALAKIKQGDFNYAVFVGEANRTGLMVRETLDLLVKLFNAVRRKQFGLALRLMGVRPYYVSMWKNIIRRLKKLSFSDAWLALQYGWKPLLNDIFGVIEALRLRWSEYPPLLSVSRTLLWEYGMPFLPPSYAGEYLGSTIVGVSCKLYYSVSSSWLYGLNSLGLINPLLVAWELKPLSFVFDWFIPIGTFLEALTSSVGIDYSHGYLTTFSKADFRLRGASMGNFIEGVKEEVEVKQKAMQRIPLLVMPIPVPYVKVAGLNLTQTISAIALTSQRMRA